MAAFDKFVRFIENNDYDVVVFDTAPTGHTLRLLDLPFDYAKQVEMMIGADEAKEAERNRFREIIETIRDRKRAVFSLVLYPESTPILESYRAMLDLKQAGIEIQFIVANMLLPEASCTNDFFAERRRMQMKYLKKIAGLFRLPVLQVPLMGDELMGIASLKTAGSVIMAGNEA
jgi:arsenite-transporting ATPase